MSLLPSPSPWPMAMVHHQDCEWVAEMSTVQHTAGHGHTRSHLFLLVKTIKQHDNLKRLVRTKSEHSYTAQGQGMLPGQGRQNKHFLFLQPHSFTRVQQLPAFAPALESSILFLFLVSQVLNYTIMPLCEIKKRPFTASWWVTTLCFWLRTLNSFLPKALTSTQQ